MLKFKTLLFVSFFPLIGICQVQNEKVINTQTQSWISMNTETKVSDRWGFVVDAHLRTDDFFNENNFYFLRGGIRYYSKSSLNLTAGYAHLWLAPSNDEWTTYSDENRIYEQLQWAAKSEKVNILQRIRIEQRWTEKIVDNKETGENRFTYRVRYLLSFDFPIFKKKTLPSLVISDEILIQFGNEIVYNTFDQNRIFIGIKQSISPKLSLDFGYMNVYQQKRSGYQFDMNHTLRLFFYYKNDVKSMAHLGYHT